MTRIVHSVIRPQMEPTYRDSILAVCASDGRIVLSVFRDPAREGIDYVKYMRPTLPAELTVDEAKRLIFELYNAISETEAYDRRRTGKE